MHRHRWVEVGRTYNESLLERAHKAGWSKLTGPVQFVQEAIDRDSHGFTNIELRCSECGKVDVVSAIGRVEAPAEGLPVDWVELIQERDRYRAALREIAGNGLPRNRPPEARLAYEALQGKS